MTSHRSGSIRSKAHPGLATWSALLVAGLAVAGCSETTVPAAPERGPQAGPSGVTVAARSTEASAAAVQAGNEAADEEARAYGAAVAQDLAALRRATAPFHRRSEAEAAGHGVLVTHPVSGAACLEDPELGGMGRHFLDPGLVDDQVLATSPEVVIYEPDRNGELHLVGVEYIIPFTIRGEEEAPPVLFGQELVRNHTFDLWALHAWVWKPNPDGLFADWNPSVSCEHDDAVVD